MQDSQRWYIRIVIMLALVVDGWCAGPAAQVYGEVNPALLESGGDLERILAPAVNPEFEQPSTLQARDLLPGYLLSGDLFHVEPEVRNDGEWNHYAVRFADGYMEAAGRDGLVRAIQEIRALELLRDSSKGDGAIAGFNQGTKGLATAPYRSVKRVVFNPLYAVEAVPGEIAEYAGKLATMGDLFRYGPYVFIRRSLGIDGARKDLAKRLQVDNETENAALQAEIKRVGWGVWVGGALPKLGDSYVDLSLELSTEVGHLGDGNLGRAVDAIRREVFPRSVRRMFKKMDIPKGLSKSFRDNGHYTERMGEQLATALLAMDDTEGREDCVAWANTARDEKEAGQALKLVQVMAVCNALEENITRIHSRDDVLVFETAGGELVALLRYDYLLWSESASQYWARADALKKAISPDATRAWWSSGEVSPRFRAQLVSRGETIRSNVDEDFPSFERHRKGLKRLEQKYERRVEAPLKNKVREQLPARRSPRLALPPVGPELEPGSEVEGSGRK